MPSHSSHSSHSLPSQSSQSFFVIAGFPISLVIGLTGLAYLMKTAFKQELNGFLGLFCVTIHIFCDSIRFRLLPLDFDYFDLIM